MTDAPTPHNAVEPVDLTPPSPWPIRVAAIAGTLCVIGAIYSHVTLGSVRDDKRAVADTLKRSAIIQDGGETHRALLQSHRDFRTLEAGWARRRLGLMIAAAVLLIGGFIASALRKLHERIQWASIDPPEP